VHNVAERIRCADYEGAQAMAVDAAIRYGSALSASKVQNPPEEDQAQASETHTV